MTSSDCTQTQIQYTWGHGEDNVESTVVRSSSTHSYTNASVINCSLQAQTCNSTYVNEISSQKNTIISFTIVLESCQQLIILSQLVWSRVKILLDTANHHLSSSDGSLTQYSSSATTSASSSASSPKGFHQSGTTLLNPLSDFSINFKLV